MKIMIAILKFRLFCDYPDVTQRNALQTGHDEKNTQGLGGSWICIPFCIPVPAGPHFLESAEFHGISPSCRAHIGIKSFQGKINLVRNSGLRNSGRNSGGTDP